MDTNTNNTQNTMGHSQCSKRDALWLCWFGGLFGAHRDLAGRKGGGCLFLLCWVVAIICLFLCPPVFFLWLAFCLIWWVMDLISLISGTYRDGEGRLLYTTDNGHYSSSDVYATLASPFGIHRFYAGLTKSATIMLVVSILAVVIVIIERILRAIIKTLLAFVSSDASDAGACGLSTLGTIVGGYFLLPLLEGYEALIVLMTVGYVGFIVMSIWAFVDFVRGLFGKVENGYGHIMLEDQEELYQLRLKDWNACTGIAAPAPAPLPDAGQATPPQSL